MMSSGDTEMLLILGNSIRRLRIKRHMSQVDLADECYIEKASLSRIETGHTNLTVKTLFKLSLALHYPMADFFLNQGSEEKKF